MTNDSGLWELMKQVRGKTWKGTRPAKPWWNVDGNYARDFDHAKDRQQDYRSIIDSTNPTLDALKQHCIEMTGATSMHDLKFKQQLAGVAGFLSVFAAVYALSIDPPWHTLAVGIMTIGVVFMTFRRFSQTAFLMCWSQAVAEVLAARRHDSATPPKTRPQIAADRSPRDPG